MNHKKNTEISNLILDKYLKMFDLDSDEVKKLNFEIKNRFFKQLVKDYLSYDLGLEDFSALSFKLWRYPKENGPSNEETLNDAIYAASELSFYSRSLPKNGKVGGNLIQLLETVRNYYFNN